MTGAAPALVGADARESLKREAIGDLGMQCGERCIRGGRGDQLETESFRVVEAQPAVFADRLQSRPSQPRRPEVERLLRGHAKADAVDHPRAGAAAHQARILEKGEIGARAAVLVRIEQVVDARVVLVDGLLDEPEAHDACVEQDVAGRVGGDGADVMDSVELLHLDQANPRDTQLCSGRNTSIIVRRYAGPGGGV